MNNDFFDRLEADLTGLTHRGTHLEAVGDRDRRRVAVLLRRGAVSLLLAVGLATSLVSEFPASAGGRTTSPAAAIVHRL